MPNAENIGKLTAALRSGEFPQDMGKLQTLNGWCCLGVACEVFRRETGQGKWVVEDGNYSFQVEKYRYPGVLSPPVCAWYGFTENDPRILKGERSEAGLNDSGQYSFDAIADLFEKLAGQQ